MDNWIYICKTEVESLLHIIYQTNERPKCKNKNYKLRKNKGVNLHNLELGKGFVDVTFKKQPKKIDKREFIKIKKNLVFQRIIIKKIKIQSKEWQKIVANYIIDKDLVSRIYKEPYNSTTKWQLNLKDVQRALINISLKKIYE